MATEAATSPNHKSVPIVTQDARFRAGQKLKQRGRAHLGASNIFETLVDRAEEEFGPASIETAAVYYELGHSLFLEISRNPTSQNGDTIIEDALEYMAKACSILYNYARANNEKKNEESAQTEAIIEDEDSHYQDWAKDQIPRVLLGIGNVQSYQRKHADAIDSYLNSVPFREEASNQFKSEKTESTASLRSHRLLAESYVLISEELLLSPPAVDLVHGETGLTIVKAEEVINLAKSYYEQGKEKLQEVVYMMASLEEKGSSDILEAEKQDVCHLATMLVDVGMSLAQRSEEDSNGNESAIKKKRIV